MADSKVILQMSHISKSFPGVKALDDVSLTVRAGTVHALMGENGAGKSTLMKCAFGLYHPDEGEIQIDGVPVTLQNPRAAMDKGVSMIHQELQPIRTQNVMENIWIGRYPYRKVGLIPWVDEKKMYADTKSLLDGLGIHDIDPRRTVGELSVSHCQLLEIARAVSYGAKVIIMDEPTSSLTEVETELLFKIIERLTGQGVAIIYISHKIDEILRIADEVTIMRDGRLVGTWPASELNTDLIVSRMVGREMTSRFPPKNHQIGGEYLRVEQFTSANPKSFKDISFSVHRGEILGIGGLVGAQRTELMESVFGLRPLASGRLVINGREVKIENAHDAIANGLALLTEERRASGIIPMLDIVENTVVADETKEAKRFHTGMGLLNNRKRAEETQKYVDQLQIKTPDLKTAIRNLSGGNQQKVLLGRWMLTEPDILILDEPTRGIDVGAKYEIYSLMEEMVQQGKCVIMISSEMPELLGMSDRILVMCEGHLSGIIDGATATDEQVMLLASRYESKAV